MKKSEIYQSAMLAVVEHPYFASVDKLEIVKQLLDDKAVAEWSEKKEAEQA